MALVDWFTELSDALQVAFVGFVFALGSSLMTIWLTNRHTWKLERQRWENDRKRDYEIYERSRQDRELVDQRRLVESLAGDCSLMSMKLAWLAAHSSSLFVSLIGGKGLRREDAESVMAPMESILMHMGLCVDASMRSCVEAFAEDSQMLLHEIHEKDRIDIKQDMMKEVSLRNARVQLRAREILNGREDMATPSAK